MKVFLADLGHNQLTVSSDTYGEHPAGLGKFTRTLFARYLRRTVSTMNLKMSGHMEAVAS